MKDKLTNITNNKEEISKKMEYLEFFYNIEETKASRVNNLMSQVLFEMIEKQEQVSNWHWHINIINMETQDLFKMNQQVKKAFKTIQFKLFERQKLKDIQINMNKNFTEQLLKSSIGKQMTHKEKHIIRKHTMQDRGPKIKHAESAHDHSHSNEEDTIQKTEILKLKTTIGIGKLLQEKKISAKKIQDTQNFDQKDKMEEI